MKLISESLEESNSKHLNESFSDVLSRVRSFIDPSHTRKILMNFFDDIKGKD